MENEKELPQRPELPQPERRPDEVPPSRPSPKEGGDVPGPGK